MSPVWQHTDSTCSPMNEKHDHFFFLLRMWICYFICYFVFIFIVWKKTTTLTTIEMITTAETPKKKWTLVVEEEEEKKTYNRPKHIPNKWHIDTVFMSTEVIDVIPYKNMYIKMIQSYLIIRLVIAVW